MKLEELGWNTFFGQHFTQFAEQGFLAGRIASEQKNLYRVVTPEGELSAQISGKLRFSVTNRGELPAVGDWVVISIHSGGALIHEILPRKSKFSRKAAGNTTEEQIVACNVDKVFLVSALNNDFNLRRLERYLTLAWDSGADPVIVLSKADLCPDFAERCLDVEVIAPGVPVLAVSSYSGAGMERLQAYIQPGSTIALLGSSGVGKSSLINALYGEQLQKTKAVRHGDDRGKHTTTSRELILLPSGGLLIDTPGMRELQLWGTDEGLEETFSDIQQVAAGCRFADCRHEQEPGCAVQLALAEGRLDQARYNSYLKLKKELAYLSRKENQLEFLAEKAKWKKLHQAFKSQKHR